MNIAIRLAVPADAENILKIYSPFIKDTAVSFETETPSVKEFAERIKSITAKYPYLVCEADNKIVGYAYASRHRERVAYKYSADVSVYIDHSYHRRGIGKALYVKLLDLLRRQGVYTAYAGVTIPNDASIGLHKSLGFRKVGVYHNVGYKQGKWHDVMWLEKALKEYGNPEEAEMNITIRLAVPADAPDMAEIHMRSWEAAYKDIIPEEYIREKNAGRTALWERILGSINTTQYIIKKDGKTAGMMGIGASRDENAGDDTYELMGLYLLPEYFRQGIGTQAMEFAFDMTRVLGKKHMTVWLLEDNLNAKRFYKKCGFISDGNKREQNFGKPLNSIRMRRDL